MAKPHMPEWFYKWETLIVVPIMFSAFPIPLAMPICIIGMCIEQPEEWLLAVIFFSLLIISISIISYMERKYQRH